MTTSSPENHVPTVPDMEQPAARVTFDRVLHELRSHNFAVLSTVSADGSPHSAGVNYGVSRPDREFAIYIMTRKHLLKARNIVENSHVSMVVPLSRRLLWFLPPATIQLRGAAQILDSTDSDGIEVFRSFWMGRRILDAYAASARRGEARACFIKVSPDPVITRICSVTACWHCGREWNPELRGYSHHRRAT